MTAPLAKTLTMLRGAIERHGGGWAGVRSVVRRSYKVLRVLGWNGFLQRVQGANRHASHSLPPPPDIAFPPPAPLEGITLQVGVMAHVFYPDLIDEFVDELSRIPIPFVLMVSVMDEQAKAQALSRFRTLTQVRVLHIRVVPNRGRDLAPMLLTFRDEILSLDVICHIHTKKSLYTGSEQEEWRRYLLGSLLGSKARIAWILGVFQATPQLGIVYPDSFRSVPLTAHTWLSNAEHARELGDRLGIAVDTNAYLDFAAGSMFWIRVDALRPLYDLGLTLSSFPEERGQTDGTLQHALERMFVQVARQQQMLVGVLPADGKLQLNTEGARNWEAHFDVPIKTKIAIASIEARIVSFDVFDTLVLRPFLRPSGARSYLAHLVKQQFGLDDFEDLRCRAEGRARAAAGQDVDSTAIYRSLAAMPEAQGLPVEAIHRLELETERSQLRPRHAIVESAKRLGVSGKSVIALSDMYMGRDTLHDVLPASVAEVVQQIHASCDTGWRKDTGEAWNHLPAQVGFEPDHWLHIGDNEHSDFQVPHGLGFIPPVHVLRPGALLEVVPALRRLRPSHEQAASWQNQLWLGLVANRLTDLADSNPDAFGSTLVLEDPETLGYTVFGPLVFDYLAWMARLALNERAEKILFLSREGHLLQRAYLALQKYVPALASLDGVYLLASRRGIGTPMLRSVEDFDLLLGSTYTGSLYDLVKARMGKRAADLAHARLGNATAAKEIYLPAMRTQVVDVLRPAADDILEVARCERDAYLKYWANQVGNSRAVVSDLGYAGSIQTRLAKLTGAALGGAYFALKQEADQTHINDGWARARFHDERVEGKGHDSPIFRNDLLLESVLTSPDGQFSHFEDSPAGLRPFHATNGMEPALFSSISSVHRGVEAFVRDMGAVIGADALNLEFDKNLVQQPLHCLGTGLWQAGAWFNRVSIEDDYTGRGMVTAKNSGITSANS